MRRRFLFLIPAIFVLIPAVAAAFVFLSISPSSVNFPTRCTYSAADPKTVTVRNDGNESAAQVSVDVSPSSMSTIFPIGGQTNGQEIAPGEDLQFQVGFNPVHVGTSTANAVVTYSTPEPTPSTSPSGPGGGPKPSKTSTVEPQSTSIPLSGNAIDRFIDVSPLGVNFGTVRVGKDAPEETITIYDDGDSTLTITGISVGGRHPGDFVVKDFVKTKVRDGHPAQFTLAFKPRAAGARAAELDVQSDSCEQPSFKVQLGGVGLEPDVIVDPAKVDFGARDVGTQTKKRIVIKNQGGWPLELKDVVFESADPTTNDIASFQILKQPVLPKTLKPAKSVTYEMSFNPTEPGARLLRLKVMSNDPDHPNLKTSVEGTGVIPPTPSASPTPTAAPPPKGGGFHLDLGPYIPALGVTAAVAGFFAMLVIMRRRRGIPE